MKQLFLIGILALACYGQTAQPEYFPLQWPDDPIKFDEGLKITGGSLVVSAGGAWSNYREIVRLESNGTLSYGDGIKPEDALKQVLILMRDSKQTVQVQLDSCLATQEKLLDHLKLQGDILDKFASIYRKATSPIKPERKP